jgi:hypothetical protein
MAPDVSEALARLGQRPDWVGDDDLVFPGEAGSGWCAPRLVVVRLELVREALSLASRTRAG